jgi:hypothetical protein
MLSHFRSIEPSFATDVTTNDSQKFAFVTIQKPSDLRQRSRQRIIRKHAKQDVDRVKAKRHRATIEPLRPAATEQTNKITANISSPQHSSVIRFQERPKDDNGTSTLVSDQTKDVDEGKLPDGGQGLLNLSTYPVQPSARMIQLFEFSKCPREDLGISLLTLEQ